MKALVVLIFAAILVEGCTAYQKQGFTGGFSETQLGENVFQVTFKGNAYTSRERVSDFNLLRSAEITLENGYRYFVIVDSEKYSKAGSYRTPTTSQTTGGVYGYGNSAHLSATTTTTGGQAYSYSKPTARNTIVCFKDKPDTGGLVYDATFVATSIRKKYEMK